MKESKLIYSEVVTHVQATDVKMNKFMFLKIMDCNTQVFYSHTENV